MSSPIYIPINIILLKGLIDQIDQITMSLFACDEIIEDIYDFINTHIHIYEFDYEGNDTTIINILTELNDIKSIIESNCSDEFKVETIRMLPIYRCY